MKMISDEKEVDPVLVEKRLTGLIIRDIMLHAYQKALENNSKDKLYYE